MYVSLIPKFCIVTVKRYLKFWAETKLNRNPWIRKVVSGRMTQDCNIQLETLLFWLLPLFHNVFEFWQVLVGRKDSQKWSKDLLLVKKPLMAWMNILPLESTQKCKDCASFFTKREKSNVVLQTSDIIPAHLCSSRNWYTGLHLVC